VKLRPDQAKSELERWLGRKIRFKPEDADLLERLETRARQIDPEAYAAYDRQGLASPMRLQDRRAYALVLAGRSIFAMAARIS
jgi:hypothetical protein